MAPQAPASERVELRLDLEGMTCASCAARIEKKLNRLDGVEATVNFAAEQATVHHGGAVSVTELLAAVESVGYGARLHEIGRGHDESPTDLTRRLLVAVTLTVP